LILVVPLAGTRCFAGPQPRYNRYIAPGERPAFAVEDAHARDAPPGTPVEDEQRLVPFAEDPAILKWELFVTSGIPTVTSNPPPGEKQRFFSPIFSTLIYGERDAVLVDTFMTVNQNDVLVDWVRQHLFIAKTMRRCSSKRLWPRQESHGDHALRT